MKVKLTAVVERGKGKRNFSCFATEMVGRYGLLGYGASAREAMEDIMIAVAEYKEMAAEKGEDFPDVEFDFRFDVGAFFDYYPLDVTAVAKYIGVNPSVLRQYVAATRMPRKAQIEKIRNGIAKLAEDLGQGLMIDRPSVDYVE